MAAVTNLKKIIGSHLLADGMDIIVDLEESEGSWLVDRRNGDRYLDCFSMFASMAVGFNHPDIVAQKEMLGQVAVQKPSSSDIYSQPMAEFLQTFYDIAMPSYLPHFFMIEGGALAVENGLKAAFDWKIRKNFEAGTKKEIGTKIIHFRQAFHGRSGYTLSLTNTADPRKTQYFPKFDWPRIVNPKIYFPLNAGHTRDVETLEQQAISAINDEIAENGADIAALIIEPIQGEGGDNHFRDKFFIALRKICDEHDIIFIMDEVQSGIGLTGKFWAHEHFSVRPDILCFGKKTQVCGILASTRMDEIENNVFRESSRINSTFGGNLIDMVRCSLILKIIKQYKLIENAEKMGAILLKGLGDLSLEFPDLLRNARGRGLMCAIDLNNSDSRNCFLEQLLKEKILLAGCGEKSIRFRPHLIITEDEINIVLRSMRKVFQTGQTARKGK